MDLERIILVFAAASGRKRRILVVKHVIEVSGSPQVVWRAAFRLPSGRIWQIGGELVEVVRTIRQRLASI